MNRIVISKDLEPKQIRLDEAGKTAHIWDRSTAPLQEWIDQMEPVGKAQGLIHVKGWTATLYINGVPVVAADWAGGGLLPLSSDGTRAGFTRLSKAGYTLVYRFCGLKADDFRRFRRAASVWRPEDLARCRPEYDYKAGGLRRVRRGYLPTTEAERGADEWFDCDAINTLFKASDNPPSLSDWLMYFFQWQREVG